VRSWFTRSPWRLELVGGIGEQSIVAIGVGPALTGRPGGPGALQLAALLRYPHVAHGPAASVWIALLAVLGFLGGYGLLRARPGGP